LKSFLKAKKRATLDQAIRDVAVPVSRIKLGLHLPDDDPEDKEKERNGE
jgi:hypothetical protein